MQVGRTTSIKTTLYRAKWIDSKENRQCDRKVLSGFSQSLQRMKSVQVLYRFWDFFSFRIEMMFKSLESGQNKCLAADNARIANIAGSIQKSIRTAYAVLLFALFFYHLVIYHFSLTGL